MKRYRVFIVTAEPFIPEVLSGLFWELDINGINEIVNGLELYMNEDSKITVEDVSLQLQKLVEQRMLFNFQVEENFLEDKNWNEEWEKNVNIIEITDKIVIKPTFREYQPKQDQIIISIDPKMSFGTGEHQTTKLMLKLLEKYINKGMKVLDAGTGTGVLAIAAVKLGADYVLGIDNDEWSYNNSKENCLLNDVENKIEIKLLEINKIDDNNFDLIAANIQKNILINIADELKKKLKRRGLLILSGLLYSDEEEILNKYNSLKFESIDKDQIDDWIALVFRG